MSADKYLAKMESDSTVPGFTMSAKTRPLVISKLESYIREKTFVFHSVRLLEELKVFIWLNGKAQAQSGYNDDLTMALGMGLFVRDTALKFSLHGKDMARAALDGFTQVNGYANQYPMFGMGGPNGPQNPYIIDVNGQSEDIRWLLG
jgi:hypothetical protein